MQAGDVVGDRWRLVAEAPGQGAVRRWRGAATDTGEPVEILTLRAGTTAEARRTFLTAHRALAQARDPALCPTTEVIAALPAVVRAPLEDRTLEAVSGPLPAGVVAAIGARLIPAVIEAGAATQGALLGSDVGLDAWGKPVLAPWARPLNAIDRTVLHAVAPETFSGGLPDGAAGLYGLGALLYRLSTGRALPSTGARAERPPPTPPSALRHTIPPDLDRAVLKLLSSDPSDRAAALPLLLALADELPDLRPLTRPAVEVRTGPAHTAPGRHAPLPGAAHVVVTGETLARLDPDRRSAAAGYARLPVTTVDALAAAGLPLVVERVAGSSEARRRAAELERESGLPLMAVAGRSLAPSAVAAATGVAVTVAFAVGAIGLALGAVPVAGVAIVSTATFAATGGWLWRRTAVGNALVGETQRAVLRIDALADAADPGGALDPSWRQLARVRRVLAGSNLPEPAAADLRGALKDLERRLLAMAEVWRSAARALDSMDLGRMRTRLAAFERAAHPDPAQLAERDRLARTLADVDEVEGRRRALTEEARAIDATLEEIAAAIARAAAGEDLRADGSLQPIVRTTLLARRAIRPLEEP